MAVFRLKENPGGSTGLLVHHEVLMRRRVVLFQSSLACLNKIDIDGSGAIDLGFRAAIGVGGYDCSGHVVEKYGASGVTCVRLSANLESRCAIQHWCLPGMVDN